MKLSKNEKGKTIQTQGGRKYVRQKTVTVRIRLTPELTEEMLWGGWSGEGEGLAIVTLHHCKGVSSFLLLCFSVLISKNLGNRFIGIFLWSQKSKINIHA